MVIHEMSREECLEVLAGARLARLACARENQPYVVPVYVAYDVQPGGKPCLYGFTTPGQKVEWMRANPLVCIEVDEVTAHDNWLSVIAFGSYEELPTTVGDNGQRLVNHQVFQFGRYVGLDDPGRDDQQVRAHQILQTQAMWWEPACTVQAARVHRDPVERFAPVYYRVCVDRVTGHRATPDPGMANRPAALVRKEGWLSRALNFGRRPSGSS